ncbi:MAG: glycosyltransferase family 2 protein [Wolinella sp.]
MNECLANTRGFPLISIITVVYNGAQFLGETILSVINQTYPNLEYIIIDGGSNDGSVEIIKKYEDKIAYWVSEPDKGIADAFNKGIRVATGEYINFQGDGDGFLDADAIRRVFACVDVECDTLVSARIQRVDIDGKELYTSQSAGDFRLQKLLFKMPFPHQGLFMHRSFFDKYGLFDERWIFSMDYELLLRAYHEFPRVRSSDVVVARWRADGIGNGRALEILKEYYKIKKANKVAPSFILFAIYCIDVVKAIIKKVMGDC